jgi:multidrug efflux pump subunit AcrB
MSVAAFALRYSRACALIAAALVVGGVITALTLPSSIYPPMQFPRIVIIAHSGTLPSRSMMLIVTRPLEQAALEVPGIRRVRSKSIRGGTEISAQFDPSTDMVIALQQLQNRVAEIRGELPADTELQVERLTPAVFPVFILALTGNLPTPDLNDYGLYVIRPALARVAGAGQIEVQASDSREIEVVLDPLKPVAS